MLRPDPPADPPAPRRVLIFARQLPRPNWDGTSAYLIALIQYLAQRGYAVEFVLLNPAQEGLVFWQVLPKALADYATVRSRDMRLVGRVLVRSLQAWPAIMFWSVIFSLPRAGRDFLRRSLQRLRPKPLVARSDPARWSPLANATECRFAETHLAGEKAGVAMVAYAYLAPVLEVWQNSPQVLRTILTIDILHQRVADLAKVGLTDGHNNCTRDEESAQLHKANLLVAIQSEDAKTLRAMAPEQAVITASLPVHPRVLAGKSIPGRCLVVSSQANNNIHGLQWFLECVWPRVRAQLPHATLHVCGTIGAAITGRFPGVTLRGRVDDLTPEYAAAQAYVAPILAGSGLKIKLIEALAHGRACVATPAATVGLSVLVGTGVLVGVDEVSFAQHVTTILTQPDERRRHEMAALHFVREYLPPDVVYAPLLHQLDQHFDHFTPVLKEVQA